MDRLAACALAYDAVVVQAPNPSEKRDAHHDLVGGDTLERVQNGVFNKVNACHRSRFAALKVLIIRHDKQVVGVLRERGVVIRPVPTGLPVVGVRGDRHGDLLMAWDLFAQQAHKFRVLVALEVRDVLNVHIHAVEVIFLHILRDLRGKRLDILQSVDACGTVPVVA